MPLPANVVWLTGAVAVLVAVVAGAGLALAGDPDQVAVQTIRGQTVQLYGDGLYEFDTIFQAANNRSGDLVMLLAGLPLLLVSLHRSVKGSLRGRLLLLGSLGYFLYMGTSYTFAVAYNELFLVYVALFSAALFAFVLAFASCLPAVSELGSGLPRRGPGAFMVISGIVTLAIWLMDPIGGILEGRAPRGLDSSTTLVTHAFDIGVIVPAAIAAGVLILNRRRVGYVIAFSLLVLEAMLMPTITLATIFQVQFGVDFAPGEIIGPVAGFSLLAVASIWVIVAIFRLVPDLRQVAN